jgi:hypothetical protein
VVTRQASKNSATTCDIYYWPPTNTPYRTREAKRKRRSKVDQEKYFEDFPSKVLTVSNFNYVRRPLGLNNKAFEIVRKSRDASQAGPTGRKGGKGGRSYKEVEESAGLLSGSSDEEDLSDIEYKEGFDIDMPLCPQVNQHTTGLRHEHKKRKKYRDPETCCTPPMAEDMLWSEIDEDPIGVYNELGGRSSPSTPPPLRAVKLTSNATAEKILQAIENVREKAKELQVLKEQDLEEEMASHDVAIKKFKNYVDSRTHWPRSSGALSERLRWVPPSGVSFSSNGMRGSNFNRMQLQKGSIMAGAAGSTGTIKVRLPMKSVNGKRPVVELVMATEGKYQPIKFSNNMQVTETIPKAKFEQANSLGRTVYQKATQVPRVGDRPLYLAINPSGSSFLNGALNRFKPQQQQQQQQQRHAQSGSSRFKQQQQQLQGRQRPRPSTSRPAGAAAQAQSDQVAFSSHRVIYGIFQQQSSPAFFDWFFQNILQIGSVSSKVGMCECIYVHFQAIASET